MNSLNDIIKNKNRLNNISFDPNKIYISGFRVNKKTHKTIIKIISHVHIENGSINVLKEILESELSIENISLDIEFEINDSNEIIIKKNIDFLLNEIKAKSPLFSSLLSIENISYDEKSINVKIENGNKDFLERSDLDKIIYDFFLEKFNLELKVNVDIVEKVLDSTYKSYRQTEEKKALEKHIKENGNTSGEKATPKKNNKSNNNGSKDNYKRKAKSVVFRNIKISIKKIEDIDEYSGLIAIEGEILKKETRDINGGKSLVMFSVTDLTSSITCKFFTKSDSVSEYLEIIDKGEYVKVEGEIQFDTFQKELVMFVKAIEVSKRIERVDDSDEKRIELHLHTKMSAMDGVVDVASIIKQASLWGHKAIAITDHGVVQAFPDAYKAGKENGIKIIYGVECYLLDDTAPVIYNMGELSLENEFIVVDIETTGLNAEKDKITEIACVKINHNRIVDSFQSLVNPKINIPSYIEKLTGITNEMVLEAPLIEKAMELFFEFTGNLPLVAHNAGFDIQFLKYNAHLLKKVIDNQILDTLALTRKMFPELKSHRLSRVANYLGIKMGKCHRALEDSMATAKILIKCIELLKTENIETFRDMQKKFDNINDIKTENSYHAIILVRNYIGLKNLYRIISESHLNYFYKKPRVSKKLFINNREGLLIGSACESGELFRSILNKKSVNEISKIVRFYDYLEVQPLGNNTFMVANKIVSSWDEIKSINKKIIKVGQRFGKPVVATCDVHFQNPEDEIYRRILMSGQGFSDADNQAPLYFRTTKEMLKEFDYLDNKTAIEIVIDNTNYINSLIDDIKPIPDGTFPPKIEGAEIQIKEISEEKAKKLYGVNVPKEVRKQMDKELSSIINNGFSVMYIIAMKLVRKSLEDGYLVGSRGSVGSSFVAYLLDITEVNSLPPHYRCPECKYSDFESGKGYGCGFDMPEKKCPVCEEDLIKDGYDIPFETFLGFDGDKEPDIDLNFSGKYQPIAHKYTEELFGKENVFRAGTISKIASKTAYGFVKGYLKDKNMMRPNAEINRLVSGCEGVKKTTGQHPGGVMIVPKDNDIYEFTPIQRPADDKKSNIITTHFDYHSISGRLLKLDILGHDDPTVIKMLEDLTGIDARTIPIGEKKTMEIFSGTEPLGLESKDISSSVGTLGIPEFGTKFVRQMLVDTKPTTFSELIRISGLSHGTDVWLNNAQDLIRNGTSVLSEVISTRDDIMLYLIQKGLVAITAFKIMEDVRKGKGLKMEYIEAMKENNVPNWYIKSCNTIKYMFPKAHAAAYVMMAFRIAWFKVYYPKAFYVAYFTVRADDFDAGLMIHGRDKVVSKIKELEGNGNEISAKEKNVLTILEIVNEMYARGIKFLPVDIYKSDISDFKIVDNAIRPPLNSLQGLGDTAAKNILEARKRKKGKFKSIDELRVEARISKTVIEIMKENGCLSDLPESNQMSFFDL